ncbi:hypothetical protein [Candidatus Amarolinea aalborgensis]
MHYFVPTQVHAQAMMATPLQVAPGVTRLCQNAAPPGDDDYFLPPHAPDG